MSSLKGIQILGYAFTGKEQRINYSVDFYCRELKLSNGNR